MSLKKDFQPPRDSSGLVRRRPGRGYLTLTLGLLLFVLVIILFNSGSSPESEARTAPLEIVAAPVAPTPPPPVQQEIKNLVQSGETITALLGDYFSPQEIHELNIKSSGVFPFTKICAGQPYRICTTDGDFDRFVYEIDEEEQLIISRDAGETQMERAPIIYDVRTELLQGTITSSLFMAVQEIGEESKLAFMLADIFAWDIDFILDLRVGDTFQVLVEKRFRQDQPAGYGKILAAEFINRNKVFRAVLFKDGEQRASYYNESGENVRKAFLKAPLSFTRISSGFTMKRLHPITKTWKAHPAIDYVAPVGTPIKTVGDGSISRIGYTAGNGNFIEVRHSNGYKSLYLHMKGFARSMAMGKRVTQGQVIGYLGGTGLATGPHLCFRMKLNGAPVNPTRLKVPAAKSVSKENLAAFQLVATPLLAQLTEQGRRTELAKLEEAVNEPVLENAQ